MNLLASFPRIVVASWGRSGSAFLSEKIGLALDTHPIYNDAKEKDQFNTQDPWPIHAHLILSPEFLSPYTVIFSVRESSTDCIMSMILARHNDIWHNYITNPTPVPEPFEFTDWKNIPKMCGLYVDWHMRYHNELSNPRRFVVVYEHMIKNLPASITFSTTYNVANSELIKNYDEVKAAIEVYQPEMQKATEPFRKFQNSVDILACINHTR
jgi:hypothetical protein